MSTHAHCLAGLICLTMCSGVAHAQAPAPPVRISAAGDVLGSNLSFAWAPVPNSTWYHLMIQDSVSIKLDAWYTASQAQCAAGEQTCTVRVNLTLAGGVVYWWVQAFNAGGYSPWSTRGDFMAAGLLRTTLRDDTSLGINAGRASTLGSNNTALGSHALFSNTLGDQNVAVGGFTMAANVSGLLNTAVGMSALASNKTGSFNVAIGGIAGASLETGSNNIYVSSPALASGESNTIRIGDVLHDATYVAGIFGKTSASGIGVSINSSGKLGTFTSSERFKQDIADIGDGSERLLNLRPVVFRYTPALDPDGILQYGLIAEEVARLWPELVVRDSDGRPETVRYHLLVPLLINELQRADERYQQLTRRITQLEAAIATRPSLDDER